MNNLTKRAALPGSGAGCMSALPAEKNLAPKATIKTWPTLEEYKTTVQMKAPYFDELPEEAPKQSFLLDGYVVVHKPQAFEFSAVYDPNKWDPLAFPPIDLGEIGGDGA